MTALDCIATVKLKCDEPISSFAANFKLRPYAKACKLFTEARHVRAPNEHVPEARHVPPAAFAARSKAPARKDPTGARAPRRLPEVRFLDREKPAPFDGAVRWCVNRLMGRKGDQECAVGFFYDKVVRPCTG